MAGQSHVPVGAVGGRANGGGSRVSVGANASTRHLTTSDAMAYMKEVKDTFTDQREKFREFLDIMRDFEALRLDTDGVLVKMMQFLRGHPKLILGLKAFLPKGYEITLTDEDNAPPESTCTCNFSKATNFVVKIKKRFQNKKHVYKSFLDILSRYGKDQMSRTEVGQEVAVLFNDEPDLLEEFGRYIQEALVGAPSSHTSLGHSIR